MTYSSILCAFLACHISIKSCDSFTIAIPQQRWTVPTITTTTTTAVQPVRPSSSSRLGLGLVVLSAKRRKNEKQGNMEDFNRWYDQVDDGATPDDVFWSEMERQRASSGGSLSDTPFGGDGADDAGLDPFQSIAEQSQSQSQFANEQAQQQQVPPPPPLPSPPPSRSIPQSIPGTASTSSSWTGPATMNMAAGQSTEKALASYADYMVSDNWLDEEYEMLMMKDSNNNDDNDVQDEESLNRQLEEWEREDEEDAMSSSSSSFGSNNEPWDAYWEAEQPKDDDDDTDEGSIKIDLEKANSKMAQQFLLKNDYDDDNDDDINNNDIQSNKEEAERLANIAEIQLRSKRLENARHNPRAASYFARKPRAIEGYDTMWVSAIDNACTTNLNGVFRNYGIEFADNFGDFEDGCQEDGFRTIEEIASYKARQVYEVTGLPCIAARTSFEVEPAKTLDNRGGDNGVPGPPTAQTLMANRMTSNPRVTSGYRFNDVGNHVDYIVEALEPVADPARITRFRSCFCYYDGDMEIIDYGELDCALHFSNSMRTYIPMSSGISQLCKTLQLTFGLEFQKWLKDKVRDALTGSRSRASIKLRDRVLKEGRVLPNDIIDVSAFMDSQVDVNLMDDCAKELTQRFEMQKPTKILTVATTGLVIAIPMAKYLQVPVVYARKERSIVMSSTWQASFSSKTVGKNRELLVSKEHIDEDDRILIIDDFLSSGASQEALLRIVSDAGATAVGVGVLMEKVYDAGRQALSGFDVKVESLVGVASVAGGILTLEEEEGYSAE